MRRYTQLTKEERIKMAEMRQSKASVTGIAASLLIGLMSKIPAIARKSLNSLTPLEAFNRNLNRVALQT